MNKTEDPVVPVPLTTYIVQANKKYRFRLLNCGIDEPLKVHIDKVSKGQQLISYQDRILLNPTYCETENVISRQACS